MSAPLLPDRVKQLWTAGRRDNVPAEQLWQQQEQLTAEYKDIWFEALRFGDHADLKTSLLSEVGDYVGCTDLGLVEQRCRGAVVELKDEWERRGTDAANPAAVEAFYDQSQAYPFDLMWWHTLSDDTTPLAYVVALKFAQEHGCRRYLDFGSGVGSAGILFARHGFDVTLADISDPLIAFASWRLQRRGLVCTLLDLKRTSLPDARSDIVTAMDVWEHLADPVGVVDQVADAIAPGGFLFGRFAAQPHTNYPQHIVVDFAPTFRRLAERGFVEAWRDDWMWGHQAFQKT
jgi:predicted TPR repeat methyltransferase